MQPGAVDFELFTAVAAALATGGMALAGYVLRRQAADNRALTKRVVALETRLHETNQANIARHDNGLADLWQAFEQHRVWARASAGRAEERAFKFREASLAELGTIKSTLARLEARFSPAIPLPDPHPGE